LTRSVGPDWVYFSRKNERLVTQKEYFDSPDTGHYAIHHAIFQLLESAPVDKLWLRHLSEFLSALDFQQVSHPETIENVLSRWARLDNRDHKGEPEKGYFRLRRIYDVS
jgi:hypothetical protein